MILRRFRLILPVDGGRGRQGDEREEEHLALADYAIIASITLPPEQRVKRLLIPTMPTPPPSRTSSLSVQPLQGECLVRCTTPSALSSPPPYDVSPSPEQPTSQRSCLVLLEAQYEFGESSTARPTRGRGVDYGFVAVEEQPLPPIDSPTAESPGYVVESDPEENPEEYEDDETEDGPVDYPMDGGEDGDDDDGDSSRDDANDEDEEEDEEEEEHLAPADSAVVVPTVELVSLPEGT
ncbi:hypothetical protein Tco_1218195 [Tanacetum coccineum]